MNGRRGPALALIVALLVAGGVVDRTVGGGRAPARVVSGRSLMPTAAPEGALSSSWFCAGTGGRSSVLVLANAGAGDATGQVEVVNTDGARVNAPVAVPALSSTTVSLSDLVPGELAAVVDLDVGQVAAEVVVDARVDHEVTPCASAASSRWYLADGSTAKDASLGLSLFNPFPEDAIADLSFSTDQGRAVPADLQGLVVPARSLRVVPVGEHVRRRESVATEIMARSGRLVAVQHQTRTVAGRAGISVTLGAPSTGSPWYFADGVNAPGLVERLTVFNPGDREAVVLVEVVPDEGVVEPFERAVPARAQVQIVLDESTGVPPGMPHATTVRSLSGPGVVVARSTEGAPPSPKVGRADTVGARRLATRWLFSAGGSASVDQWIMVANLGPAPAEIALSVLSGGREVPVPGVEGLTLAPGQRRSIPLDDAVTGPAVPVLLRASSPVLAERALYAVPGLSAGAGIPLG